MRALCSSPLRLLGLSIAVCAPLSTGCNGGMLNQRDELKMAVQEFNDGIRWGKADQTASRLPVDRRRTFTERYSALEDELEVMDYEVQRIEYDRSSGKATARVDVSWSLKRRGLVERSVLEEEFKKDGGWMLVTAKKVKGAPFPLLDSLKAPPAPAPVSASAAAASGTPTPAPTAEPAENTPAAVSP